MNTEHSDLRNSIVIKATLTDKGRKLLSRGKFKIAKFALGDDELDYELLDSNLLETMIADESVTGETVPVPYIPAIKNANSLGFSHMMKAFCI